MQRWHFFLTVTVLQVKNETSPSRNIVIIHNETSEFEILFICSGQIFVTKYSVLFFQLDFCVL